MKHIDAIDEAMIICGCLLILTCASSRVIACCSYLYVEDVAAAFDTVLHKGEVGQVYNIGTEKERSVLDVSMKKACQPVVAAQ
jgi:hypothetical protein